MSLAALREILNRYIGRCVAVQSYGYRRYIGKVATVTDEFVVLKNATALDDYEGSRWDDDSLHWRVKEDVDVGFAETVLALASIVAVTSSDNEGLEPIEKAIDADQSPVTSLRETAREAETTEANYDAIEILLGCEVVAQHREVITELIDKIGVVRRALQQEMGFAFPKVRIRDSILLAPSQYSIKVAGTPRGGGFYQADKLLALGPERVLAEFSQSIIAEPVWGKPAIWISPEQRNDAELRGLNCHSFITLLTTHLRHVVMSNICEIFNYEMTCQLLVDLSITSPALHQEFFSSYSSRIRMHEFLLALLTEGVYPSPIERIAEAVALFSNDSVYDLVDRVRLEIVNTMLKQATDPLGRVTRIQLSNEILDELPQIVVSEELAHRFQFALLQFAYAANHGRALVLVLPYEHRRFFSRLVSDFRSLVMVISTEEYRQCSLKWASLPFSIDTLCGIGVEETSPKIKAAGNVASNLKDH